jgi:hypothetical protein
MFVIRATTLEAQQKASGQPVHAWRSAAPGPVRDAPLGSHRIGDDTEWTVDRHLAGKPAAVIALYHRFIELAEACGPFTYSVAKTAITLKGTRRGFAGATLAPTHLDGYMDLQRQVEDPRIRRSVPYSKKLFVLRFRVRSLTELDDEFAGWMCEAYAVGQGAHLAG